jgi:hypothetical protein
MQLAIYHPGTGAVWARAAAGEVFVSPAGPAPDSTRRWPGPPAPAAVTADESRSRSAAVEQMQRVFHELHADGRNALCAVCDGQYGSA